VHEQAFGSASRMFLFSKHAYTSRPATGNPSN